MGYKRGGERRGQYKRIAGMVFGVQPGHRPVQAEDVYKRQHKCRAHINIIIRGIVIRTKADQWFFHIKILAFLVLSYDKRNKKGLLPNLRLQS